MSLDYLAKKNYHERDTNISFRDEGHLYTIKHQKCLEGDTGFTSVTTWIHSLFDKFDADKIIDNMMKSSRWSQNKYYGMTKEDIKQLWDENRDTAAAAGTKLHYDIECTYNKMAVSNDSVEFKYFQKFYEDYTSKLEPYRTEMLVYDEDLRLAGSIDMIFRRVGDSDSNSNSNGDLEIYDWKRSKEIVRVNKWNKWIKSDVISHLPDTNYWHYSLQLNTYKYMLEKNYGEKVVGMYLVCLHPNNENNSYIRLKVPHLKSEINDLMNLRKSMIE